MKDFEWRYSIVMERPLQSIRLAKIQMFLMVGILYNSVSPAFPDHTTLICWYLRAAESFDRLGEWCNGIRQTLA